VISGNNVSQSPNLSIFEYSVGSACYTQSTPGAFTNNRIVSNTFRAPIQGTSPAPPTTRMYVSFPSLASSSVSGNLIEGNDFGREPGPVLVPIGGFINGGANICDPSTSAFCVGGGTPDAIYQRESRKRRPSPVLWREIHKLIAASVASSG
jgi:hypothetical protein